MLLFVNGERLAQEPFRLRVTPLRLTHFSEIIEGDGYVNVIGFEVFG